MKQWGDHCGAVLDTVNGFDVIDCCSCNFRHIVPIPTNGELESIYRTDYYSVTKPFYLSQYLEDLDWWNLVYGERYDTFEELLPPERRRVLDVGSGPGLFLLHGKERGWETIGLEPSIQAVETSRKLGLHVIEAFLDQHSAAQVGRVDVVHMSEVLEHLPNPAETLRLVHPILEPHGLLCTAVPNDYNPFQRAVRETNPRDPWWLAPPHHINYFDFESFKALVESCGFEVILQESTFPIDLFLLLGYDYTNDDSVGRQCHSRRIRFEQNLVRAGLGDLKRNLYRLLASQGIGREAVLYARRLPTHTKDKA